MAVSPHGSSFSVNIIHSISSDVGKVHCARSTGFELIARLASLLFSSLAILPSVSWWVAGSRPVYLCISAFVYLSMCVFVSGYDYQWVIVKSVCLVKVIVASSSLNLCMHVIIYRV